MNRWITRYLMAFALLCIYASNVYAQQHNWFKGGGSTYARYSGGELLEGSYHMCTDRQGNVYSVNIVGNDPLRADTFRTSGAYGASQNILVTSYDCSGRMRWAKLIGSLYNQYCYGIVVDSFGHLYIAGHFLHGTSALHIGYDTIITSGIYQTLGVMQLDTRGRFNWLKYIGQNTVAGRTAAGRWEGGAIALDRQQNFHLIKFLQTGAEITSSVTSTFGTYDLTYNSSGNLIDVKRLQMDTTLLVNKVALEKATGKLYAVGHRNQGFTGGPTFYPYVAAFDTARRVIWMDTLTYPTFYDLAGWGAITNDEMGHLYLTNGSNRLIIYGRDTIYNALSSTGQITCIFKLDTGNRMIWSRGFSGSVLDALGAITMMPNGRLAATGGMTGMVVADHDTIVSYSGEGQNPYFTVLDTGGQVHRLQQLHGSAFYDWSHCIASDTVGNLYIGGDVADSVWADSARGYRTTGGASDFFVTKYGVDCNCTVMPNARFTDTGTIAVGFTFTGTASSSGIDSIRWNFGDGTTSSATNPIHTFSAVGTYHTCVWVYSACGSDRFCKDFVIRCLVPPTSSITASGSGATRTYIYSGTTTGLDSVVWQYSDGARASGLTSTHTFSAIGTYVVCVTAYNPCGIDSICRTVIVPCLVAPTASYSVTGTLATRNFTYSGTTVGVDSIVWTYGDGRRDTGATATHSYAAAGTYTACVTAYSPCGSHSSCQTIVVPCVIAPTANFTYTGVTTINFTYTGTSVSIDSLVWDFGDGGSATGATPSHTYAAVGSYTVCVTAYNPCGSNSFCRTVTIPCVAPPVASFINSTVAIGSYIDTFTYTGTTIGIDSIAWYYGDGLRGTGTTSVHNYAIPDTYLVCVYAYNACGSDSECRSVVIPCDTPVASFTFSGITNVSFNYTGTTTHVDSIRWVYGDGTFGLGATPTHTYATSGTYQVCVLVYTNCAWDSVCKTITATGVGLGNNKLGHIQIHPNPVQNEMEVTGIIERQAYRILALTGSRIQEGVLDVNHSLVHIASIPSGIYLLELIDSYGIRSMLKFVKE